MITIYLMGGLGNQLFQIFTVLGYFLKYKIAFKFPNSKNDMTSPYGKIYKRPLYWDNFLDNLKKFTTNDIKYQTVYREKNHNYNDLPFFKNDVLLFGYFQSYKYFDEYKNKLFKLIKLEEKREILINKLEKNSNEKINQETNEKINQETNENIKEELKNSISLHFRIGDYVHNTKAHPILDINYYETCLKYLKDKTELRQVIYFCEDKDIEIVKKNINYLKECFPEYKFKRSSNFINKNKLEDWEEMLLMSCCGHNIIANSSFSWWGAYFNENENVVCYPSVWFGENLKNKKLEDMFLDEWVKIII